MLIGAPFVLLSEQNRPAWGAERTASESVKATRWSRGAELEKTRSQDTSGETLQIPDLWRPSGLLIIT